MGGTTLDRHFGSPLFGFDYPASGQVDVRDEPATLTVRLRSPGVRQDYGLQVTSSPAVSGQSAAELLSAELLQFHGTGFRVEERLFDGHAAVWRIATVAEPHYTIASVVHGYLHLVSWYLPLAGVQQEIIESFHFTAPANDTWLGPPAGESGHR